jgi:hypothetical protein
MLIYWRVSGLSCWNIQTKWIWSAKTLEFEMVRSDLIRNCFGDGDFFTSKKSDFTSDQKLGCNSIFFTKIEHTHTKKKNVNWTWFKLQKNTLNMISIAPNNSPKQRWNFGLPSMSSPKNTWDVTGGTLDWSLQLKATPGLGFTMGKNRVRYLGLFKVMFYFPNGKSTMWGIYSEYFLGTP